MRQPLDGEWQAWYDPPTGVLYIDPSVPDTLLPHLIAEVQHELLGNHHLAPHVHRPRPRFTLIPGERSHRARGAS